METEPTAEQRQRQAFQFLRDHARNAHIAGDGLLVGVLCHTGLHRVEQLAKVKKLLLPFSDIAWMPIFALYWLVDPSERYVIEETLKKLEQQSEEDRLVAQWVNRYQILIEQPLAGDAQLTPAMKDFAWPNSFAVRSAETEALVTHLIELAWFHGPSGEHWKQLADIWLQNAPAWTHPLLKALKERLDLQARLTAPEKPHDLLSESDTEKLRAHYDVAELWLLHLHGRSVAVCEAVERLAPFLSAESHRWRVLHDFIHFNSMYDPREDSQGVRLARRRRLSVETPLLIFHDERESRLTKTLGELFRSRSQGAASKRWEIYILARLHELAALRLWDYGMWLEAIRAQAQANLEVVQWTDAQPDMSAQGLTLAVRSFSATSPEKNPAVRRAIDTLEFAPGEVLARLGESLSATYPKQKHSAAGLLEDLTDLLPPEAWPELAQWTITYSRESTEQRTGGWQLAPATHWLWVMPVLSTESPTWTTLKPEALGMAKVSHCWRGDQGEFLRRWLLFAPPSLARETAEAMAAHPETESGGCFARAELLIEFEEWNPSLRGTYTRHLLPATHSASEALILAKHLEEPDVAAREAALRDRLVQRMREAIAQATPEPSVNQFSFSPPSGVHLVSHWRPEDQPMLEELIAAVNSPNVLAEYLPWLLATIQTLVANGPVEFSKVVQPHIAQWTRQLPRGRKMLGGENGPLSIMQWNSGGEGEIVLMLGWLAFQIPRKLGAESHAVVLTWARQMLLMGESRPLDLAIYGSAVVALQMPASTSAEPLALMETAILSLSARSDHDPDAMQSLSNALAKISSLIGSEHFKTPAGADSPPSAAAFVSVLSRFIPRFARSPRATLRAAIAALVWQLEKHGREEAWIAEVMTNLQRDHRARVRFEAQGGWKEARSQAVAKSGV